MVVAQSGGATGLRDHGALDSAVAQPMMAFGGQDLYPSLADKATALGFSLIMNQPFVDGNKRIGHAALETFLVLNGHELVALVDEQEKVILQVAAGKMPRDEFLGWIAKHLMKIV
jgi:death-on-curing protein